MASNETKGSEEITLQEYMETLAIGDARTADIANIMFEITSENLVNKYYPLFFAFENGRASGMIGEAFNALAERITDANPDISVEVKYNPNKGVLSIIMPEEFGDNSYAELFYEPNRLTKYHSNSIGTVISVDVKDLLKNLSDNPHEFGENSKKALSLIDKFLVEVVTAARAISGDKFFLKDDILKLAYKGLGLINTTPTQSVVEGIEAYVADLSKGNQPS
jgi:hypothetical protein